MSRPYSLRGRLYRRLLGLFVPVLLVSGIGVYLFVRAELIRGLDATLTAKARALAAIVHLEERGGVIRTEMDFRGEVLPEYSRKHRHPEFFVVLEHDGAGWKEIESSESFGETKVAGVWSIPPVSGSSLEATNIILPNGEDGRMVWIALNVYPDNDENEEKNIPGRPIWVAVGKELDDVGDTLEIVIFGLVGGGILALAGAVLAVRFGVDKGMKPVDTLARSVAAVDVRALPERIDIGELPTELNPIGQRLNELIARMKTAMDQERESAERERRFTSAAAHELRTPLAELRSLLEIRERWPDSLETCVVSIHEAKGIVGRLERMTGLLLDLARSESACQTGQRTSVDLIPVIQSEVSRFTSTAIQRGLAIRTDISGNPAILGSLSEVECILSNLLANAINYAKAGSTEVCLVVHNIPAEIIRIEVTNDVDQLTSNDLSQMFEPFWRKDVVRSSGGAKSEVTTGVVGGSVGLGLAISRAVAIRMGGSLQATLENGRVTLSFVCPAFNA